MSYANDPTTVDASALSTLLSEIVVITGGQFNRLIYLKGVGSTVAGSWVTYDETGATTLLVANAVGPVAIAMGATNTTGKYGWYLVEGTYATAASDTTAANKALYIDGTAGRVDDLPVAGDLVVNAWSTASDTANALPVRINRPFVTDVLG